MSGFQIILDLEKIVSDASPIPSATDRAAIKAFLVKVAPDLVDLVFDAGGLANVQAALQEVQNHKGRAQVGALGDGIWLKLLITYGPQIFALVQAIIVAIPKSPTPVPAPAPAPSARWLIPDGPAGR